MSYIFFEDSRVIHDRLCDEFFCAGNEEGNLISKRGDETYACAPFGAAAKEEKGGSEADLLLAAFRDVLLAAFCNGLRNRRLPSAR